ncbi:unnamed protein product [Closterium sp. NIES-64]|nr:unnamed protein product [Closterium sp. NIES-64]
MGRGAGAGGPAAGGAGVGGTGAGAIPLSPQQLRVWYVTRQGRTARVRGPAAGGARAGDSATGVVSTGVPGAAGPGGARTGGTGVLGLEVLQDLEMLLSTMRLEALELEVPVLGVLLLVVLEVEVPELVRVLAEEVLGLLEVMALVALELEVLELLWVLALEVLELLEVLALVALELEFLELLRVLALKVLELLEVLALVAPELEVLELLRMLALEVLELQEVLELLVLVALQRRDCSSLRRHLQPGSERARAAHPTVTRLLAIVVTDPSFESATASALVAELVDFAAACRLDYAASLDRQEDLECLAAAAPHLVSTLLAPEGVPDAPDIPTPRSYTKAIAGPYSPQWQTAMDAEMASWKSTGTYVDEVPPPGANIIDGMWIFRVKRPLGSPHVFKARYVARGFSQQEGVGFF